MKQSILIITMLFEFIICYSQKTLYDGYYINKENDTIYGKIKQGNNPHSWQLAFVTKENKRELHEASDIKGYYCNNHYYESCYLSLGYYYLERIVDGRIKLFLLGGNYYIQKENDDVTKLNNIIRWTIIEEKISDNKELLEKVKNSSHNSLDFIDVIREYNLQAKGVKNQFLLTEAKDSLQYNSNENLTYKKDTISFNLPSQKLLNLKLNLLGSGIGIETKISNSTSLYLESGIDVDVLSSIYIYPYIKVQPRIYTNLKKRSYSGKNTSKFSGNYISPYFVYIYPSEISENETKWYLYGISYGFQRQKIKFLYYGADFGVGILNFSDQTNYDQNTFKYTSRQNKIKINVELNAGILF